MQDWQTQNAEHLSAALAWLHAVLERHAQAADPRELTPSPQHPAATVLAAPADSKFAPALVEIARCFNLSAFEQQILLLCAALELSPSLSGFCGVAQGNPQQNYPTFALALTLFDEPDWRVVMEASPLRRWQLIEVTTSPTVPLTMSPLRADMRIVGFLNGVNTLDSRLQVLVEPVPPSPKSALPASQATSAARARAAIQQGLSTVQLLGTDAASQQQVAIATAQQLGLQLYRLPAEQLPTDTRELTHLARLWERETRLLPVVLFLNGMEIEPNSASATALRHFLERCGGPCILGVRETSFGLDRNTIAIEIEKPTALEQRQTWEGCLGQGAADVAGQLASQFRLNLTDIHVIAATAVAPEGKLFPVLWRACLEKTRPTLENLAQRLEVKATWDDLVLPATETETLQQIAAQVRDRDRVYDDWGFRQKLSRGLGVSALFAGASGTGKTMAAEVIANELQLHLYRIDLSAVVSKYIGETEKNLSKLFDAAEDGGAILFFDEADALFGKRSEVKDARDRHANIEINYLLQRLEAFGGLAILATNIRSSLDTAFVRRLRFIVTFPSPGHKERLRLWQKVFPAQTPLEDLDYERLARLNLAGGNIHAVAINAAFLAARDEAAIGMAHILAAAKAEYRKLERPIGGDEFRLLAPLQTIRES